LSAFDLESAEFAVFVPNLKSLGASPAGLSEQDRLAARQNLRPNSEDVSITGAGFANGVLGAISKFRRISGRSGAGLTRILLSGLLHTSRSGGMPPGLSSAVRLLARPRSLPRKSARAAAAL